MKTNPQIFFGFGVTPKANNFRLVKIENRGHFIEEEQPEIASRLLLEFFN